MLPGRSARPVVPAAVRVLAVLCVLTGIAAAVLDGAYLVLAARGLVGGETVGGYPAAIIRAIWALLRATAFVLLAGPLRRGVPAARPIGIILAGTTAANVARLVVTGGTAPGVRAVVVAGTAVVVLGCLVLIGMLVRSRTVREHLAPVVGEVPGETRWQRVGRWFRERGADQPTWVVAVRPLAVLLTPLAGVPFAVAVAAVAGGDPDSPFGGSASERAAALPILLGWGGLLLVVQLALPWAVVALTVGARRARWAIAPFAAVVLLVVPPLCLLMLGVDGLVRDGLPVAVVALALLYALLVDPGARAWYAGPARPDA